MAAGVSVYTLESVQNDLTFSKVFTAGVDTAFISVETEQPLKDFKIEFRRRNSDGSSVLYKTLYGKTDSNFTAVLNEPITTGFPEGEYFVVLYEAGYSTKMDWCYIKN